MNKMTNRRFDVLDAIRKDPFSSYEDLCKATGIKAKSNILYHINVLEMQGYVTRRPGGQGIFIGEHRRGTWRARKAKSAKQNAEGGRKKAEEKRHFMRDQAQRVKKSRSRIEEQKRIERVVRKALKREGAERDVIRDGGPLMYMGRKAWRVG